MQKRCVAGSTASRRLVGAEEKYVSHVLASRVSSVLLTRHLGGTSSLSRNLEASNGTDNGRECTFGRGKNNAELKSLCCLAMHGSGEWEFA